MTTTHASLDSTTDNSDSRWTLAGVFLDALARRDFTALSQCVGDDARFRALIPPGPIEMTGPEQSAERFIQWFGGRDSFEVLDATAGQVGPRLYMRWRIRMVPSDGGSARIAEQHAFATVGSLIESLDLVCSGWQDESGAANARLPS